MNFRGNQSRWRSDSNNEHCHWNNSEPWNQDRQPQDFTRHSQQEVGFSPSSHSSHSPAPSQSLQQPDNSQIGQRYRPPMSLIPKQSGQSSGFLLSNDPQQFKEDISLSDHIQSYPRHPAAAPPEQIGHQGAGDVHRTFYSNQQGSTYYYQHQENSNDQNDRQQWKPQQSMNQSQYNYSDPIPDVQYTSSVGYQGRIDFRGNHQEDNYGDYCHSYNPAANNAGTRSGSPLERYAPHDQVGPSGFPSLNVPQGQHSTQSQIPLPILNEEKERTFPVVDFQNRYPKNVLKGDGGKTASDVESLDQQDQRWIDSWLRSKRVQGRRNKKSIDTDIKIPVIRHLLKQCFGLLDDLKKLKDSLTDCEGDEETWSEQKSRALQLQGELERVQSKLDKNTMAAFREKLERRTKKKSWRKKRNAILTEEREEKLVRRQQLHDKIDAELGAKRQKITDAQKEKEMKAGADKTLSEVRKKLSDANKSLDLLRSLKKLRQIRKDSAVRKGMFYPAECDRNFERQVFDLIKMMETQKKTYEDEEKTLQVILEMEQQENLEKEREQFKNREEQKVRKKQNRNLELLFGKEDVPDETDPLRPFHNYYLQAEQSLQSLLHIRREWDTFTVPDHVIGGSSIPQGWVVPYEPTDEVWASALKNKR
ncbi:programmed cell death protein 7-like [Lineus longissimus]|uniref:programmed cell death protein 7-like n=1 Tax=Lineus longissimus TaxID=88925 RepID=UPI002B4D6AF2